MNRDDTFHASIHAAAATDNPRQDDERLVEVMARAIGLVNGDVDFHYYIPEAEAALAALRKFEEE